jgi:putative PIN family toxin of toxin-antitoxin system
MRVVYDTSVVVTIFARRGEILKFKRDILTGRVIAITSDYILAETEAVLSDKFQLTKQRAKSHTRLYARIAIGVNPEDIQKVSRDSRDDPILATAVAGQVKYIITLDKDLLVLKEYKGIRIISPGEFAKI